MGFCEGEFAALLRNWPIPDLHLLSCNRQLCPPSSYTKIKITMKNTLIGLAAFLLILSACTNNSKPSTSNQAASLGLEKLWESDTVFTTAESALFDEATRSLEQQPPRSPSSDGRECSPLPTPRGTRAGDESASAPASDDEPIISSVGSVRPDESAVWKKSKSYEYIPHSIQPDPSLFGHVLLPLRVRQGRDWMTLDAESGQYVFMGGRKFQLIMIMLVAHPVAVASARTCCTSRAETGAGYGGRGLSEVGGAAETPQGARGLEASSRGRCSPGCCPGGS